MIDKKRLGAWAKIFCENDSCIIHVEKTKTGGPEVMLAGDPASMVIAMVCTLNRVSQISDVPLEETMAIVNCMAKEIVNSGYTAYKVGEKYMPDSMPELSKLDREEHERNISELNAVIKSYGEALDVANNTIKVLREKEAELRQIHSKEMQALKKENNALEAQLRLMEKRNMFGGSNGQNDI